MSEKIFLDYCAIKHDINQEVASLEANKNYYKNKDMLIKAAEADIKIKAIEMMIRIIELGDHFE